MLPTVLAIIYMRAGAFTASAPSTAAFPVQYSSGDALVAGSDRGALAAQVFLSKNRPRKLSGSSPFCDGGVAATAGTVAFPVQYSADERYLVDQNGVPFPIMGRTAWFVTSLPVTD